MTRIVTTTYCYKPVTKAMVVGKTSRLKLSPPSTELQARKRRLAGRLPFWHANRIAKLRKLWGTRSNAAIARELDISKAAVFRQARRLALPPRRLNAWPRSRVAMLRALWRSALGAARVAIGGDACAPERVVHTHRLHARLYQVTFLYKQSVGWLRARAT